MNKAVPIVGVADFFRFVTGAAGLRPGRILALAATLVSGAGSLLHGQIFDTPPPEIVSAWKHNSEDVILVFRYDGSYYQIQGGTTDPGMERGTFTWDKDTQAFTAETIVDTNGTSGLSHPAGATSISITGTLGENLNYTVVGEGTFSFTRVVNTGPTIIGSWIIPGEKFSITFLADNSYYLTEETNDIPFGYTGMEKGNYTWNPTSKAFTAAAAIDTNGDVGVNGITLASGVTINITGNSLVFFDGVEATTLLRLTTNPTPFRLPDFGTIRFANYNQTSNSTPALQQFDVPNETAPYYAEAFVDPDTNATAPTLKIGTGDPITISADMDYPGSFFVDEGFSTLNALNAFLPASTAIQFKDTTATANLTTATTLTFPSIPKINISDGGNWSGDVYLFGDNEVLRWTLPTGFDATKFITILEVVDSFTGAEIASAELHGDVTHFDLTGKLNPDDEYEVELEFYRIDDSTTTGTGVFAGKQGYVLSSSSTFFKIRSRDVFPETPLVTEQPVSQPGTANSPLLLTVGINEAAFPFSTFQWFKNNQEIPGQTGNTLFIPSFNLANDSGRYKVVVTNDEGTATSNLANVGTVGTASQHVQFLVAYKRKISEQQSASLLTSIGASFDARVEGLGITGTFPASSITLTKPNNSNLPLALDDDHWDVETDFATLAALQTAFPDGSYQINIGSDSVPINMNGTNYPNQPLVTASAGTWVNGKLQITASQAAAGFSLTSNATTGDGFATLSVIDIVSDNDIVYEEANTQPSDPKFVTASIAPNLLTVGKSYEVETEFDEAIDSSSLINKSWGLPPDGTANAFGLLSTTTVFTIEVVTNPSGTPYSTWQSGFFNPTQLANPAISGDDADFDKDGVPNLLEYLFGGNPTLPSSGLLPAVTKAPGSNNVVFTYKRKLAATGVTQVIEHATNLSPPWTPAVHGASGVTIGTTAVPGDASSEQVTVTIPSTSTSRFVRLKAVR